MTMRIVVVFLVTALIDYSTGWSVEPPSTDVMGSPGRCAICGKPGPCQQKICQIQCTTEKVKKSCWDVETENICTMLPRRPCPHDGQDCGSCQAFGSATACECETCDLSQAKGLLSRWLDNLTTKTLPLTPPLPGRTRAVKKLVKKEYVMEKPVYKPVVVYVCAECLRAQACGVCDAPKEVSSPSPADNHAPQIVAPAPQPASLVEVQPWEPAPLPPLE
ncbi:MAG: hypothetical protein ACUVQR_02545 [Thermogutta sp.]